VTRYLRFILTLIVLAVFGVYFITNTDKFRPLLDVNPYLLIIVALLNIMAIFGNGLFTKLILRPFDKYIPMLESFYVSLISSVGNFFAPVGAGFGFRAIYLKKKHGLPYNEYISTLAGNYIIVFLVSSLAGMGALFALRGEADRTYVVLLAAFAALFVVSLALSIVKRPISAESKWRNTFFKSLLRSLHKVTHGWSHIASHGRLMVQLIGLTTFNLLLMMSINWLIINSLGFDIGFAQLVLFSVLGSLSLFINITPANIGVKEAVYIFSSTVIGFSLEQILLIALIDRGVLFLTLLGLWVFSSRIKNRNNLKV
jgi:uncharacterized protein (TIRG00374 family)